MEENNKNLSEEVLNSISGAGDDIELVASDSPCPCGGSHTWIYGTQTLIAQYYYCDKCGQWLEVLY